MIALKNGQGIATPLYMSVVWILHDMIHTIYEYEYIAIIIVMSLQLTWRLRGRASEKQHFMNDRVCRVGGDATPFGSAWLGLA